jgi:hypothetical protein
MLVVVEVGVMKLGILKPEVPVVEEEHKYQVTLLLLLMLLV